MPLNKDRGNGGTERNGSKTDRYCSHCYQKGEFVRQGITVEQMRALCIEKMVEMRFPQFVAKLLTRNLHKLDRWKNA